MHSFTKIFSFSKHWLSVGLSSVAFTLVGCVEVPKYPTIEPVSFRPSGLAARAAVAVNSLTPTFTWKTPDLGGGVSESFDFAVWDIIGDGSPGEVIAHREGILGTSYSLETPLMPDHEYFWSVKKSGSSVWATVSFVGVSPIGANWGHGLPFKIKTASTPTK